MTKSRAYLTFSTELQTNDLKAKPSFGITVWVDGIPPHIDIVAPTKSGKRWRYILWDKNDIENGKVMDTPCPIYLFKEEL